MPRSTILTEIISMGVELPGVFESEALSREMPETSFVKMSLSIRQFLPIELVGDHALALFPFFLV